MRARVSYVAHFAVVASRYGRVVVMMLGIPSFAFVYNAMCTSLVVALAVLILGGDCESVCRSASSAVVMTLGGHGLCSFPFGGVYVPRLGGVSPRRGPA